MTLDQREELPWQRQLISASRPLDALRSFGGDEESRYDYSYVNDRSKVVGSKDDSGSSKIPRIEDGQQEAWTRARGARGGRGRGGNAARRGGAGRSNHYSGRLGQGAREWQRSGVGRGGRGRSGPGGRMGQARGREGRGRDRSRPDAETVASGKALATRVKELGQAEDWKGVLQALEERPKNAIVCTVAVNALGRMGKWREAVGVLDSMGRDRDTGGDRPDAFIYASAINACGKAGRPLEAVALLSEMPSRGVNPDVVCHGAAIAALSEVAGTQNRIAWGARTGAGGEGSKSTRAHEKAVALVQHMRRNGPSPNQQCFASAITACARARDPMAALRLVSNMREDGVAPNEVVLNAAVDACGKGGAPDEAVKLLRGMERAYGIKPNNVSYNSAISALSRAGRAREARDLLKEMASSGLKPDRVSFSAAMQGFAAAGDRKNAESLSEEMRGSGVSMDVVSYGTAVSACGKAGDVKGALRLIEEMESAGIHTNVVVYNSALDACGRTGNPEAAAKILSRMTDAGVVPNAISYTGAIAACSRSGEGSKAIEWLEVMSREGIAPETICYNYAMTACGRAGDARQAAWLLRLMKEESVTPNRISYSAAMFALGKAGRLHDVLDLLTEMEREGVQADEVTYHIAVDAASIAGDLEVAMRLFREMRARGLPVPKRRVDYVRDRITRGAGRREQGPRKKKITVEDDRMTRSRKPKSLGRGGGGGRIPAVGKELHEGRDEGRGERGGTEEAGADFLAELREAFRSNETEELASDDDLATLAAGAMEEEGEEEKHSAVGTGDIDRPLVGPWVVLAPEEESGGVVAAGEESSGSGGSVESGNPVEALEEIRVEGPCFLEKEPAGETDPGVSTRRIEGGASGGEEGVDDEQGVVLSLEDIKNMKAVQLKAELRGRGLRLSGNKAELVARLEEALEQQSAA